MDFSLWQIGIVLVIALLVFGPKRLPSLGKSLGSGMKEFKDSITGKAKDSPDDGDSIGHSLGSGVREFRDSIAGSVDDDDHKQHVDGSAEEVESPPEAVPAGTKA
jgi:sec-independent protein translocase protein TatA